MDAQDVAGEIKRTTNQYSWGRCRLGCLPQSFCERGCGFGRKVPARAISASWSAGTAFGSPGMAIVTTRCASPAKGSMKLAASFVLSMPQMRTSGPRIAVVDVGKGPGNDAARRRVVAAIKPKFGILRQEAGERAGSQPLHARRPDHRLQSMLNVQFRNALDRRACGLPQWHCRHCRLGGGP